MENLKKGEAGLRNFHCFKTTQKWKGLRKILLSQMKNVQEREREGGEPNCRK